MSVAMPGVGIVLTSVPGEGQFLLVDGETPLQALLDDTPHTPLLLQDLLQGGAFTWQYRNETSLSAALLGEKISAPFLAGLVAWGGEVILADDVTVPVREYVTRRRGGSVQGLRLPVARHERTTGASRVSITPSDHPIVLAAAMLAWDGETITDAGLAIHGATRQGVHPVMEISAWIGQSRDAVDAADLAERVAASFQPRGDFRGSAEYRREMAGVVIRRALTQALKGEEA